MVRDKIVVESVELRLCVPLMYHEERSICLVSRFKNET